MPHPITLPSKLLFLRTIFFVIIIAAISILALIRYSRINEIKNNLYALGHQDENYRRLDTCITILYEIENNSRFFLVTLDSAYHRKYTSQLESVSKLLSSYESARGKSDPKLSNLLQTKESLGQKFVELRLALDSLMTLPMTVDTRAVSVNKASRTTSVISQHVETVQIDSVVPAKSKRRLFKRLVDAISNKDSENDVTAYKRGIIRSSDTLSNTQSALAPVDHQTQTSQSLNAKQRQLNAAEEKLLLTNSKLLSNIQAALQDLKIQEESQAKSVRDNLLTSSLTGLKDIKIITFLLLLIVLILASITIFNLIKLYRKDRTILEYAELTVETVKRKGSFLAQMAHEIRTPLNSIIGFSQLIDSSKLDIDAKLEVNAIKNSSQLLLSLVNEILDFSKFEIGMVVLQAKNFSPTELLKNAVDMLSVLANKKNIHISQQIDLDPKITLYGDDHRIRQVVINLVTNAIKFTPENGTIHLTTSFKSTSGQAGEWNIAVKDSGIGIARENLLEIFEDYIQVDADRTSEYVGSGLGLAICKRIVDLFNGSISVESVVGMGSEFIVKLPLPLATEPSPKAKKISDIPKNLDLTTKKILIVDDVKINLLIASKLIEKIGAKYELASDGNTALQLFESNLYDMVITDIQMPGMDGIELTRHIRSNSDSVKASVPIVAFTGAIPDESDQHYEKLGITAVLPKPFEEKYLRELLQRLFVQT